MVKRKNLDITSPINYNSFGNRLKDENGISTLSEVIITPKQKLKPSQKRRIVRRELMRQALLSNMIPITQLPVLIPSIY